MEYKALLTQVEKTIEAIDTSESSSDTVLEMAGTIARNFRKELGITGGRLWQYRDSGEYELMHRFGRARGGEIGMTVSPDYAPIATAIERGAVVMDIGDPGVDPVFEKRLGAKRFAAIAVGEEDYILSFDVSPKSGRDDILFSLNLIRHAMNNRLRTARFESLIAEALKIQQSILPQRAPSFATFDIWGRTVPAEHVSGDFYDYIPVSESSLGLAVADGSGHGLPAALVVRDIYMGLRMGTDRDFKIIRTVEKLNQIIHRSRLTTKFVSLFYGELESNGAFIYCNAGHNPPFILRKDGTYEALVHGGAVLGPTPNPTYSRGYANLRPGELLCLYTDGIIEAPRPDGDEFSIERLRRLVKKHRDQSAKEIGQRILEAVDRWSRGEPADDRTVVIVKNRG